MVIFEVITVIILAAALGVVAKIFGNKNHKVVNSFKQSLDLTGFPIITFYQGERKLNFLIDTGSTGCHIDSRYVSNEAQPIKTTNTFGMEGNVKESNIYKTAIYLNDKKYTLECISSDLTQAFDSIKQEHGVILHGILGSNFFNAYNYIIDFEKYIFYTNKK